MTNVRYFIICWSTYVKSRARADVDRETVQDLTSARVTQISAKLEAIDLDHVMFQFVPLLAPMEAFA